jgi:hypothetical protein
MALTTLNGTVPRDDTTAAPDAGPAEPPMREVRYEYSHGFAPILSGLRTSRLVSTYPAGKLVAVGVRDGGLTFSFHNFERAMGVAVRPASLTSVPKSCVKHSSENFLLVNTPPVWII